jgi:DNA-directed RNA polymerase beta' subunit
MNELMDIAAVPYMILAPRDGKPIIEIVQDTLVGSYRLTKDYTEIHDKTMANIQMVNSYFTGSLPKPENKYSYSGKEAYSQILPPSLYINRKNKKDEKVIINNSVLESGNLDKNVFHGISTGLIPVIYHDYGPFEVRKFLDNTQRLICRWLLTSGFSVGISDLVTDKATDENLKNKIKEMQTKAYNKLDQIRRGTFINNSIFNNEDYIERELIGILRYQPIKGLHLRGQLNYTTYGLDTLGSNWGGNVHLPYTTYEREYGNVTAQGVKTNLLIGQFSASYMVFHNFFVDLILKYYFLML